MGADVGRSGGSGRVRPQCTLAQVRVGVNGLHLVPQETGGSELYARRLLPALLQADGELELVVFASREGAPSLRAEQWGARAQIVTVPVNARSRARRVLAEQTLLPLAAHEARIDLLHNLFTTAPAWSPVPQVTTILDVIYKRFPETHRGLLSYGMALLTSLSARRSRRILALSHAAKADIVSYLGASPDRVDVAHLGPGLREVEPVPIDVLRSRFGLDGAPLVLTVSAKRAHKNLERLVDAVAHIAERRPVTMVVPGYPTALEKKLELRAAELGAAANIRFTGWLDESTLEGLYRMADCFVFPSLAEGFGLPVLEAMLRGTPVACSNATSMPEVGGDAVLYFDPEHTAAIAAAIERVLDDDRLRARLSREGPLRAASFTWEATAVDTLASYRRALRF